MTIIDIPDAIDAVKEREGLRAENERLKAALREARYLCGEAHVDGQDWLLFDKIAGVLSATLVKEG